MKEAGVEIFSGPRLSQTLTFGPPEVSPFHILTFDTFLSLLDLILTSFPFLLRQPNLLLNMVDLLAL